MEPVCPEDLAQLQPLAQADGHALLFPTHILKRGAEILGYLSIFGTPMVHIWVDSKRGTARDSAQGLQMLDAIAKDRRQPAYMIPVPKGSPYLQVMEHFGFTQLSGEYIWFVRNNPQPKT